MYWLRLAPHVARSHKAAVALQAGGAKRSPNRDHPLPKPSSGIGMASAPAVQPIQYLHQSEAMPAWLIS